MGAGKGQKMIDILEYIPYGTTDKPITRDELRQLFADEKDPDRTARRMIARAKKQYPIINVGEGYYIPDDPDDPNLRAYIYKEMHRIKEISRGLRNHKRLFNTNKNQETMKV